MSRNTRSRPRFQWKICLVRIRSQSNLRPVSDCTEGYSISELCCCLFSVLTFLRDNPLPVLSTLHTASPWHFSQCLSAGWTRDTQACEQGQSACWKQAHIHFTFSWYSALKQLTVNEQIGGEGTRSSQWFAQTLQQGWVIVGNKTCDLFNWAHKYLFIQVQLYMMQWCDNKPK